MHNGRRWGADGCRLVTHWYEVKSDKKSKTGQTWSHTQGPEVQSDKTWSHSFLQRTLTPSHIMQHWRLNANTTKLESWRYPHYHNISCKVRESEKISCKDPVQNLQPPFYKPRPPVFQVVSAISPEHQTELPSDTNRSPPPPFPALLEIAESRGLRGVRCRQGPVAGVSASHATAAVSPQTSHSCRTGPLCSHHLCGSEGRRAIWGGGKLTTTWFKVVSYLQIWKNMMMVTDSEDYKCDVWEKSNVQWGANLTTRREVSQIKLNIWYTFPLREEPIENFGKGENYFKKQMCKVTGWTFRLSHSNLPNRAIWSWCEGQCFTWRAPVFCCV